MSAHTAPIPATKAAKKLLLLDEVEDTGKTTGLAESDRAALRSVAAWINTFVIVPHKDLGRAGPVCPFVPRSMERKTLWLAPERAGGRSVPEIVSLLDGYKRRLVAMQPTTVDGVNYNAFVVVFPDLPADRAKPVFDEVMKQLAVPAYVDDGLVIGPFYELNAATAIYNPSFRPFTPPVPFMLMRHAVLSDWKFFLDNDEWLARWAQRYGESAVKALAEELRRQPWRTKRD